MILIKTDSPDAKHFISFLDEMQFNLRATGMYKRDRNLIKNSYNKRSILASGLRTVFYSENLDGLFDRLKLLLREKRARIISNIIHEEVFVSIDNLLEYKSTTPSEHKRNLKKFNQLRTKKKSKTA